MGCFVNLFLNSSTRKVSQMKLFFDAHNIEYLDCNQKKLEEKHIVKMKDTQMKSFTQCGVIVFLNI